MFFQVTVFISCKTQEIMSVVQERCIFRLSTKPHNNRCRAPCFDLRYQDLLPEGTQKFWFLRCCLGFLVCDIAFFSTIRSLFTSTISTNFFHSKTPVLFLIICRVRFSIGIIGSLGNNFEEILWLRSACYSSIFNNRNFIAHGTMFESDINLIIT